MKSSASILKNEKLENSQDYNFLREEGLKFIQKFSGDLWTDHNIHDPGITILEILCYAITELGYKTSFEIKDLLAEKSVTESDKNLFFTAREILTVNPVTISDFRKLIIDIPNVKNAWLEPALTTYPEIWIDCNKSKLAYRNQIPFKPDGTPAIKAERLNINGFYNVTIELGEDKKFGDLNRFDFEIPIRDKSSDFTISLNLPSCKFYQEKAISSDQIKGIGISSVLQVDETNFKARVIVSLENKTVSKTIHFSTSEIKPNVLQVIKNQLAKKDLESVSYQYKNRIIRSLAKREEVKAKLHQYRNLCEDFNPVNVISIEDILVCAEIQVEPAANNEKIMAEILFQLEQFISPPIRFYTYEELIKKGKRTEEIFEGPALTHGFIDEDELIKSEPKKAIMISDLVNIIMDIDGVLAVKRVVMSSYSGNTLLNKEVHWCLKTRAGLMPKLHKSKSKFVFYKDNLPYNPDKTETIKYYEGLVDLERKQKLSENEKYDLDIPKGISRNVSKYFTIQNDFPLTYGIGEKGIPGIITDRRIAQAKQLKGYLLFFDQLLANYLAQLANVKNLFSLDKSVSRTYFYQVLYNLPKQFKFDQGSQGYSVLYNDEQLPLIYSLLKDFTDKVKEIKSVDLSSFSTFKAQWDSYKKLTGFENSSKSHFIKSLDSLVETKPVFYKRRNKFLDHLLARFSEQFADYSLLLYDLNNSRGNDELISDKIAFLKEYPEISSQRGKAHNYKDIAEVWNTNNVSGLKKRVSRILGINNYSRHFLAQEYKGCRFQIYRDKAGEWRFRFKDANEKIFLRSEGYTSKRNCIKGIESVKNNGKFTDSYRFSVAKDYTFYFNIVAENGEIVATSLFYNTAKERDKIVSFLISFFNGDQNQEGFYVLEHILFNPVNDKDSLLKVCLPGGCFTCGGNLDPYSFRISIIAPSWSERFKNMAFRNYFENTVRLEAPVHVHARICWLSRQDMHEFEEKYYNWLMEKVLPFYGKDKASIALTELLDKLNNFRSVYPEASLFDCSDGAGKKTDTPKIVLDNTILGTFKPTKDDNNK